MRDPYNYTNIYTSKCRELMLLREGGSYSFLQEDTNKDDESMHSYMEVIVPADSLEDALAAVPSSEGSSINEKMTLLFGSRDGLDHFVSYCDDNGIDTQTLIWD